METARRCHLLRVPLELRHSIYEYTINLDLNHQLLDGYDDGFQDRSFTTIMVRNPNSKLHIPWASLSQTCKTISAELTALMSSTAFAAKQRGDHHHDHTTYSLDLNRLRRRIGPAVWRHLPCTPSRAEALRVSLDFAADKLRFRGCGGPMPLVRNLYQTLNWILHYGPLFSRPVPLPSPMRIKLLSVDCTFGGSGSSSSDDNAVVGISDAEREDRIREVESLLQQLRGTGLLWSHIKRVELMDEGSSRLEMEVCEVAGEDGGVPASWENYGFEWGVEPERRVRYGEKERKGKLRE